MKDKTQLILKDNRIIRSIILLALPIMGSNILKAFHDFVDMYFISNMKISGVAEEVAKVLVEAQVSAITITGPIMMVCQALAIGLTIAGTAIMSQYIGASKIDKAKKISGQLLVLSIIIGIFFNLVLFIFAPTLLKLMRLDPNSDLFRYSVYYLRYRSFELIGLFVVYSFQATRQSSGDTITPVILNAFSIVLNIILTWIFIKFFNMDIRGAALGTVIANMIIIPVCIIIMIRKKNNLINLEISDLKWNFDNVKKLFIIGAPSAISQAFTSLGFVIINSLIAGFDDYIITAIGVGNRINSLLLFPAMAVGTVLTTFIGQNIGAGNIKRAKKSLFLSMLLSLLITSIGAIILMFLRKPMVGIFIDSEIYPESFDMCVYYLYFLLVGLPLMGVFQVWMGCFQGAGRTDYSLFLSTTRLWILRLPFIWFMMKIVKVGPASVWYAMVISNFGAAILGTIIYKFIDFKPRISKMSKRLSKYEKIEKEV